MDTAALISSILGLIYFTSWSLSFYPQPLRNLRRRSTAGTTIAYPLLNLVGFSAYTAYTAALLFSRVVRAQYAVRHPRSGVPSVSPWDLAFAAHGVVLVVVTLSQFWGRLWGWRLGRDGGDGDGADGDEDELEVRREEEEARERVRKEEIAGRQVGVYVWTVFGLGIAGVVAVVGIVLFAGRDGGRDARGWAYIDIIYALSSLKLFVTLTKYIPQIVHNARRRSTRGWSIAQILLDFVGGVASVLQLFVDAYRFADVGSAGAGGAWKDGVVGNMVKFWLGNVSMMFDGVFMVQHFWLYAGERRADQTGGGSAKGVGRGPGELGGVAAAGREEGVVRSETQPLLGSAERS